MTPVTAGAQAEQATAADAATAVPAAPQATAAAPLANPDAPAEKVGADRWFDSVSYFGGQGVDHNLKEVPGALLSGQVIREASFFHAVTFSRRVATLGESLPWIKDKLQFFSGNPYGYEMLLLQHYGLQSNQELGFAGWLRTPDLALPGGLATNFTAGMGLSQAIGEPTYEDGPKTDPQRRYRLQLLLLFEFDWHSASGGPWSIVTRLHHRSGAYGLIAPQYVGSNFLSLGLRYRF